jgi:hypothetical protein
MPAMLINDIKAKGGIIVSPQSGTGTGGDCSGTGTFAMDDFKIADQIVGCAVKNWGIDPHRIYATGCSAGGLQSGCMAMMRSGYMAAAVPNSGGEVGPIQPQDPSHIPALMTMHGKAGQDVVIVDFSQTSATMDSSNQKPRRLRSRLRSLRDPDATGRPLHGRLAVHARTPLWLYERTVRRDPARHVPQVFGDPVRVIRQLARAPGSQRGQRGEQLLLQVRELRGVEACGVRFVTHDLVTSYH